MRRMWAVAFFLLASGCGDDGDPASSDGSATFTLQ